jgi:MAF protein
MFVTQPYILVLGSTSPFRKSILEKLGIPFVTDSPDVNETANINETPQQLVARLSEAKAQAVALRHRNALVIGSDQVAVIDDKILGKPGNHENAISQLRNASGKTVTFYTGLCLLNSKTNNKQTEVVPFNVTFRQLTDQQIEHYLEKEQPYNCAGSFKSEGLGITLFEKLEGEDPNALIGLPLIRLTRMLENEGMSIL